jgi:hypothetical protein
VSVSIITPPQQIHGGWRVKETDHYWVDVLAMMFGNTRMVITPKDSPYEWLRGWCYNDGLTPTVMRAAAYDPEAGGEPEGWVKEVGTERRPCAGYIRGRREHATYVAECPDCGDESLY